MILKPWEVAPLGSKVTAFVHELDTRRKRIGLTTYAPEQWNDMLPMKVSLQCIRIYDIYIIILSYCRVSLYFSYEKLHNSEVSVLRF